VRRRNFEQLHMLALVLRLDARNTLVLKWRNYNHYEKKNFKQVSVNFNEHMSIEEMRF